MQDLAKNVREHIRDVPDWPKPGVTFKDWTPLLRNVFLAHQVAVVLSAEASAWYPIDTVVAADARGYIFGWDLARRLDASFVPARKAGKLPPPTFALDYDLEYGKGSIEVAEDTFEKGQNVLVFDDLLATGGTARAMSNLARSKSAHIVGFLFMIELDYLNGREKLDAGPVKSLVHYKEP